MNIQIKGFTLIELLVGVIIMGILTVVVLPLYQRSVEKSKATEALRLLKAVDQAYEAYYLEHGQNATKFDQLDISVPWTGRTPCLGFAKDTRSNRDWSLEIEEHSAYSNVFLWRISGKYKGAAIYRHYGQPRNISMLIRCQERKKSARITFDSTLAAGAYCEKILKAKFSGDDGVARMYDFLP